MTAWEREPHMRKIIKKYGLIFSALLCLLGVVFLSPGLKQVSAAEIAGKTDVQLKGMKELRKEASHRKRRIIFNNDGDDNYTKVPYKPLIEGFLRRRTTSLIGSQVDAIFYSTTRSFGYFSHQTKLGETGLSDLIAVGTDPLQVMADFCRKSKIEIFWSLRMNDIHDSHSSVPRKWKLEHPEYLVGSRENRPPLGGWTAVDYARPEIRELAYRFIEEVCQNYDINGVELDFFRDPVVFKSVAWGGTASQAELDMMTNLLRRIRKMTDEEGIKKGRPILLAVRVPDSVEYCRDCGMDLERWLNEDLTDILIAGDSFQLNPWEYSVRLGHKYRVPVYACLADVRINLKDAGGQKEAAGLLGAFYRDSKESIRGRAMQAWQAGVDGIYMFNHFDPDAFFWREIGDPQTMLTKKKTYFISPLGLGFPSPASFLRGGEDFRQVPVISPDVAPMPVSGKEKTRLLLSVGEDLTAAGKAGFEPLIKCHFWTKGLAEGDKLQVTLNGSLLDNPTLSDDWLEYAVAPPHLKKGDNLFELTSQPAAGPAFEGNHGTAEIKAWDMSYVCTRVLNYPGQLPWRRLVNGKDGIEQISSDSHLFLADRGTGPEDMTNLIYPWTVLPSDTVVVEARLRVEKPKMAGADPLGVCVRMANNQSVEYLTFSRDGIGLQFAKIVCPMDTTGKFHTYRVVLGDKDIQVYVDGRLRLDGRGKFTTPAADRKNWLPLTYGLDSWNRRSLLFGSASGPGTGEAFWEYIRFTSDTKVWLRDMFLSVKYVENPAK